MVLHPKFVCAVVCRLNGAKSGPKIGLKLNIAARGVATTNDAVVICLATWVAVFRQMTPGPQLHPANQLLFYMQR